MKVKKIKVTILTVLALAFGIFGMRLSVSAADSRSGSEMIVSPMNNQLILAPGESYNGIIKVSNPDAAQQNLEYSVSVGSFGQSSSDENPGKYDKIDINTVTSYNQIAEWIVLSKENGVLAPGKTDEIAYAINVPEDAPAGGQYATIVFRNDVKGQRSDDSKDGMIIEDNVQMASIIYAEIAGTTRKEGAIMENNIPSFLMNNTLEATSMVRNNGNVHTDAEYILQVWPLFSGEEICTNEENPGTSLVMPETERYHTESCQLPAVGIFRAKQTIKIFGEESIVEKTIIVCPIWLLFIIIFVIFALIFYFIAKAKTRKKASQKTSRS